jgi:hypothetical protein
MMMCIFLFFVFWAGCFVGSVGCFQGKKKSIATDGTGGCLHWFFEMIIGWLVLLFLFFERGNGYWFFSVRFFVD